MKVAIGHSTQENPVTGVAGIKYEEQLTEPVAEIATRILRQHGVDAVSNAPHTKAGDVASWANKVGADVFVDIHTDAANGKARGTSAFYYPGSSKGEVLAAHLYNFVGGVGGVRRSMHSRKDLIVLYGTKAVSALVELEFHDRADTANFVKDNWDAYGEAVAKAVLAYLGIPFNGSGSTPTPEQPEPHPSPHPSRLLPVVPSVRPVLRRTSLWVDALVTTDRCTTALAPASTTRSLVGRILSPMELKALTA